MLEKVPWILSNDKSPKYEKIKQFISKVERNPVAECPVSSPIAETHTCYNVFDLPQIYYDKVNPQGNDNLLNHLPNILVPDLIPSNANPWDHFPVIGEVDIDAQDTIKVITLNCGLGGDNDSPLEFWNNELLKNDEFKDWSDSIKTELIYNDSTKQPNLASQNEYFKLIDTKTKHSEKTGTETNTMKNIGVNIIIALKEIISIDKTELKELQSIFQIRWNKKFDDLASGERFIGEGKTMINRLIGIDNLYKSDDISEITVQEFIEEYYAVGDDYKKYYTDQLKTHGLITQDNVSYKINNNKIKSFKRFNKEGDTPYFMVTDNDSLDFINTDESTPQTRTTFMFVHMCCQILYDMILYNQLLSTIKSVNPGEILSTIKSSNSTQQTNKRIFIKQLIEQEEPDFVLLQESKDIEDVTPGNYSIVNSTTDDCNIIYSNKYTPTPTTTTTNSTDKLNYQKFVTKSPPTININVCSIHCDSKGTDINTQLTTAIEKNNEDIPLIIGIDTNISVKNLLSTKMKLSSLPKITKASTFNDIEKYQLSHIIDVISLNDLKIPGTFQIDDTFEKDGHIYHPYHRTTNKARTFIQAQPKGVEASNVSQFIDSGSTDDSDIDRTTKDYIFGYNVKKVRQYRGSLFNASDSH